MSPILTSNDGDASPTDPIINLTEDTKKSGNRKFPAVSPLNLAKLNQATGKASISDKSQAFNETKQGQKLQQDRLKK